MKSIIIFLKSFEMKNWPNVRYADHWRKRERKKKLPTLPMEDEYDNPFDHKMNGWWIIFIFQYRRDGDDPRHSCSPTSTRLRKRLVCISSHCCAKSFRNKSSWGKSAHTHTDGHIAPLWNAVISPGNGSARKQHRCRFANPIRSRSLALDR